MTLLLDQAIRSGILVLVGLAGVAVLRRQPAALRHAVLAMTILGTAALVPLTALSPTWHLALPVSVARQAAPQQAWAASLPVSDAMQVATPPGSPAPPREPRTNIHGGAGTRPTVRVLELARVIWVAGFAVCAAVLLTGFVRLGRIARRAECLRDGPWVQVAGRLQAAYRLPRPVMLLQTDAPDVVATFGTRPHRVLLPLHAAAWSPDRIHAVLSHELAHVRRQDWLVQMSAELLRCVYWFNPLMWIACARLRSESEYACDDVVLGHGMAPREYAGHLLELARICRHAPRRVALSAIPTARASTLERRITVMLNPEVNRASLSNRARVAAAALLACVSLSVAAARAGGRPPHAPPPLTAPIPTSVAATSVRSVAPDARPATAATISRASNAARSSAGPTTRTREVPRAATTNEPPVADASAGVGAQSALPLVGSVYDGSGGVLPGVEITLRDAQQATVTTTTDAGGRFQFSSVAPGTYSLEAALPGFRTLRQDIALRTAADWDRAITLQLGQLMEKIIVSAPRLASSTELSQAPTRLKVGGNVRPPRKLVDVKPVYPVSMREAGREAVVSLEAVISTDGSVTSVRVLSADSHPDFAIAAADAVRQWTFDPTRLNGVAVEVQMTVSVEFTLSK